MDPAKDQPDRPPDTSPVNPVKMYQFGPFRIDATLHQLLRDDVVVPLTSKVYDTLLVLIRNRDHVLSKEELIALVWPKSFVSDDSLAQSISVLRRALGDQSGQPEFIATIPRRGYRFVAPVTELRADGTEIRPGAAAGALSIAATAAHDDQMPATTGAHADGTAPQAGRIFMSPRQRLAMSVTVATVAVAVVIAVAVARRANDPPPVEPIQFTHYPQVGTRLESAGVLSPDGRHLAFIALDELSGATQLWTRALSSTRARALPGTEGAIDPFWSPDSTALGFFANFRLKRVGLTGETPVTLVTLGATTTGSSWGNQDRILFSLGRLGLYSVAASGGSVTQVTTPDRAMEIQHSSPQFLPDGQRFLFRLSSSDPDRAGTYLASLGGGGKVRVSNVAATFAPPGYLLSIRDQTLVAQPFDARTGRLTGQVIPVTGGVSPDAMISASTTRLLAFGGNTLAWRPTWYNRAGEKLGVVNAPTLMYNLWLTPDQKMLVADGGVDLLQRSIWLMDLQLGGSTELAKGNGGVVSADGVSVAYTSDRPSGIANFYLRTANGNERLLSRSNEARLLIDWTLDDRYLVYITPASRTKSDVWLVPRFGDGRPIPYLQTTANEQQAQVSPDGKWLAYTSDESGEWEVYVQSFPIAGAKHRISVKGGMQPRWRRDGRELFYLAADRTLMAVPVLAGDRFEASRPQPLFRAPVPNVQLAAILHYAVTADGQRFVVNSVEESAREPITVMVDWTAVLGK